MFSQLISSQIHELQGTCVKQTDLSDKKNKSNSLPHMSHMTTADAKQHRRSTSNLSDAGSKFFSQFSSKYSSQLIDKFIRSELLNSSYDSLKCQVGYSTPLYSNLQVSDWKGFDCLQGSYRTHGDSDIYEIVKQPASKNSYEEQAIHHQKVNEPSSQATLNIHTSDDNSARRGSGMEFRSQKQTIEPNSDNNSQSSRYMHSSGSVSGSEIQRSSSGSSSSGTASGGRGGVTTLTTIPIPIPERLQRRRLLQMISGYDLQNKQLQRELAKEKSRRTEELACVVKSLVLFEAKLKNDLKSVNQRMLDRDAEICRLTRLTRTLRKRLKDQQRDNCMVTEQWPYGDKCLVLEPLQCNNCRKQFNDIDISASGWELSVGSKVEPSSSSDDTLSSSFYGARRSVRYTSKRTAGTFQDYMRSRAMQIDDPALEQHSEENTSSASLEDSQTSYEQLHNYARVMERMHGVKLTPEDGEYSQQSSPKVEQGKTTGNSLVTVPLENDDCIGSPTKEEDYDVLNLDQEQKMMTKGSIKIVQRRFSDFSEASPKQIYEATTNDWYASASDQEESSSVAANPYGRGAVNPVLECVNQILLQQSMEDTRGSLAPKSSLASRSISNVNLARRSPLGGRTVSNGRKRVHFSTKNSMVHVPRHDDREAQVRRQIQISPYHSMAAADTPNYGSIYSNEYEPIGSERASNHYVDMAATAAANSGEGSADPSILNPSMKLPPALPPKPANLLKFQKSLHQFGGGKQMDSNDCGASITTASEPDYCSISEVGLTRTCVQIVVDVHKAPEPNSPPAVEREMKLEKQGMLKEMEAIGNHSDDTHSEKTDEIEGIFAGIPKLPNVAAIIAPKQSESDCLVIKSKPALGLQRPSQAPQHPQSLSLSTFQYKRKHVPNILAEINKRMSVPSSPTTPKCLATISVPKSVLRPITDTSRQMPIQAEFDWYNLDAEYDCSQKIEKDPDTPATADEYNLDEEFQQEEPSLLDPKVEDIANALGQLHLEPAKSNQKVLNLANYEHDIITKPLPCKRKIFFNAPSD